MTRLELFRAIRAAMREDRLGDVAVYKAELGGGGRAKATIEAELDPVRHYRPTIHIESLAGLANGSFGRTFAEFMKTNDLTPIELSAGVDEDMAARNAFVLRYAIIHDMVHVLTGFDTSWPGEVGVWAFVGGQNYSLGFRFAAVMALLVAPFRSPFRLGEAIRNFGRGWRMGSRAEPLILRRLEDDLERDLVGLRRELGIANTA